jgi:hypothetical protein
MDVHPSASYAPPGATIVTPFATDALYELKIDTDGDLAADIVYSVRFAGGEGDTQTATVATRRRQPSGRNG